MDETDFLLSGKAKEYLNRKLEELQNNCCKTQKKAKK